MTDRTQTTPQNDRTPEPNTAAPGTAGHRRPDQGGAPPGKEEPQPATGGEGAAGAGGPGGFGT